MRIISKFHDYYDGVMFDEHITFVREQKTIEDFDFKKIKFTEFIENYGINDLETRLLLFCGKYYLIYVLRWNEYKNTKNDKWFSTEEKLTHYYNIDSLTKGKSSIDHSNVSSGFKLPFQCFNRDIMRSNKFKSEYAPYLHEPSISRLLETPVPIEVFQQYNTPAILIYQDSTHNNKLKAQINPCLKDVQFYKVLDSWQCYQEIAMFLGGVLTQPMNSEVVDDKYKIQAHGFDEKSFRRPKSK